ncbi:hypothetical protein GBAR_LOCUS23165 [Geodia barretti]|uniref:Uncharacterized protein n=1 Tax=Geodia barretti TaxID=519541 RepID=A0AA35X6T9_GEOBA|nr:hypothetical protein GBAR_LOCUS23165 [Geodia barretti]
MLMNAVGDPMTVARMPSVSTLREATTASAQLGTQAMAKSVKPCLMLGGQRNRRLVKMALTWDSYQE